MTSLTNAVHSSSKMIGFPLHVIKTILTAQLRWDRLYMHTWGTLIVSRVQGAFIHFLEKRHLSQKISHLLECLSLAIYEQLCKVSICIFRYCQGHFWLRLKEIERMIFGYVDSIMQVVVFRATEVHVFATIPRVMTSHEVINYLFTGALFLLHWYISFDIQRMAEIQELLAFGN